MERDTRERQATDLVAGVMKIEAERVARLGATDEQRLFTTPLLVRMLLIVHFNLRRLPDQRVELYMAMVDTLLTSDYHPDEVVRSASPAWVGTGAPGVKCCSTWPFACIARARRRTRDWRASTDRVAVYLSVPAAYMTPERAETLVTDLVAGAASAAGCWKSAPGSIASILRASRSFNGPLPGGGGARCRTDRVFFEAEERLRMPVA